MTILVVSLAASVRRNISFPAPRPFHPGTGKRRHDIIDQSPIRPSSCAGSARSAIISGSQLSPTCAKPSPANAAARPNPHRRPTARRCPAGSFFGGFRTPALGPRARLLAPGRHPKPFPLPTFPRVPSWEAFGRRTSYRAQIGHPGPASETLPDSRPTSRLCRAGTAMLRAQGTFVAARRIIELRTKRSSAPNRGQVGGWLTPIGRAAPSPLSGRRCRSPR